MNVLTSVLQVMANTRMLEYSTGIYMVGGILSGVGNAWVPHIKSSFPLILIHTGQQDGFLPIYSVGTISRYILGTLCIPIVGIE